MCIFGLEKWISVWLLVITLRGVAVSIVLELNISPLCWGSFGDNRLCSIIHTQQAVQNVSESIPIHVYYFFLHQRVLRSRNPALESSHAEPSVPDEAVHGNGETRGNSKKPLFKWLDIRFGAGRHMHGMFNYQRNSLFRYLATSECAVYKLRSRILKSISFSYCSRTGHVDAQYAVRE